MGFKDEWGATKHDVEELDMGLEKSRGLSKSQLLQQQMEIEWVKVKWE
jgi:hypothetical protein